MKKGKWNYSQDIEYTVIEVKLLPVPSTKMHWQNAFAGDVRQVVAIKYRKPNGELHQFWIDNQDGSGLQKIYAGGGPGSYSAHVEAFEFIRELPESEWQKWDPILHSYYRTKHTEWALRNHPEEWEKMERLRKLIEK